MVALELDTVSVDDAPGATVVGLAEMVTEGRFCVTFPLTPPQPAMKNAETRAPKQIRGN